MREDVSQFIRDTDVPCTRRGNRDQSWESESVAKGRDLSREEVSADLRARDSIRSIIFASGTNSAIHHGRCCLNIMLSATKSRWLVCCTRENQS